MSTYSLLCAVFISWCLQEYLVSAEQDTASPLGEIKTIQKRQAVEDLCVLPPALAHGRFRAHPRRCPADDNSAACRLTPATWVSKGWVLLYDCDLGYRVDTFLYRRASICQRRTGGGQQAQWLPSLPRCVESSYHSSVLPSMQICGKPAQNTRTKRGANLKIDGVTSKRGAWPWMVVFGHNKTNGAGIHWFCAGTLVTQRHVLTTANCVSNHRNRPTYIARLDDLNLDDDSDGGEAIEILIVKSDIMIYPGFDQNKYFADNIAIVGLREKLRITDFIRPICLPTPDFVDRSFSGETAYLASWGQDDPDGGGNTKRRRFQPILHEVRGKIVNHDVCKTNFTSFQQEVTPFIISDSLMCATLDANKSCQGDVGSPLMVKSKGTFFLLGIVATKRTCFDTYPRLFTKVSLYMKWIVRNLMLSDTNFYSVTAQRSKSSVIN